MKKRKIALFYDQSTESGRKILEFLTPFDKRKSDIVGELILLWIDEHGTNVPVQWLDRKKGELGSVKPTFPKRTIEEKSVAASNKSVDTSVTQQNETEENKIKMPSEPEHDVSLIKAGLASFL